MQDVLHPDRYVLVPGGLIQMLLNALERDHKDGNVARGEMLAELRKEIMPNETLLDKIRDLGWDVAVHNDYRLGGVRHTFWLFTRDGLSVKGEGKSDHEALRLVYKIVSVFDEVEHNPIGYSWKMQTPTAANQPANEKLCLSVERPPNKNFDLVYSHAQILGVIKKAVAQDAAQTEAVLSEALRQVREARGLVNEHFEGKQP